MNIKLNKVTDINEFVNIASRFDFPVKIESDGYIINAKSIMGIFSLDLTKPQKIVVDKENEFCLTSFEKFKECA